MIPFKRLIIICVLLAAFLYVFKQRYSSATTAAVPGHRSTQKNMAKGVPDIDKKILLGHFNPASTRGFVAAQTPYASRDDLYLLKDVLDAFIRMHQAAKVEGISLVIISATRNFDTQKRIWQDKWTGERLVDSRNLAQTVPDPVKRARIILTYSSMPGTSRHHWGTDIDINSVNRSYFESGTGLKVYTWLAAHAHKFGFIQTYTPKGTGRPQGYEEEPWHWSFNPIAKFYTSQYRKKVSYADLTDFKGAHTAAKIDVIKNYVFGINPDCL